MAFVRAARKDEIPAGTIREFQVDGKTLAISNVDGKFYAINNTCLHRGGPLGQGRADGQDRHLPMAWLAVRRHHREMAANPAVGVACYPSRCAAKIFGSILA